MKGIAAPSAQPTYIARGLRRQASEPGILADADLTPERSESKPCLFRSAATEGA